MNSITCAHAAIIFRAWSEKNYITDLEFERYQAMADILDCFGEMPLPQRVLDSWNLESDVAKYI